MCNRAIHGGDLVSASRKYGIAPDNWIDLSTGVNPSAYPVPVLNERCFQQLPYLSAAFNEAVNAYYGSDQFVACNGTQQVIELLPKLLPSLPVLLPKLGYQEHCDSWIQARDGDKDKDIHLYSATDQNEAIQRIEFKLSQSEPFHLVVINPNNPTGLLFSVEQLLNWASRLAEGGFLIIDEAFIDLHPEQSVLSDYHSFCALDNVLVMRSFGKFFGLAGVRLGFLFGPETLLKKVQNKIGPWAVNGPAQAIAIAALNDREWQENTRVSIDINSAKTRSLFAPLLELLGGQTVSSEGLFSSWWLNTERLSDLFEFFAQRGVLLRVIDVEHRQSSHEDHSLLRLGLINAQDDKVVAKLQLVINEYILTLDR